MADSHVPNPAPAAVARERLDDPVTGLPVLRYRFLGAPTLQPGDPVPTGAWRVLRVERRESGTVLDVETHAGAEALADRPASIDDAAVAAALETLEDARDLGVAHGDLGPHRLWRRGDRVWVEGYGVPWRQGATVDGDVRALTDGLLALAGTQLSQVCRARLTTLRDGVAPPASIDPPVSDAPPVGDHRPEGDHRPVADHRPEGDHRPVGIDPPEGDAAPAERADAAPAPVQVVHGPPPGTTVRRSAGPFRRAGALASGAAGNLAATATSAAGAFAASVRRTVAALRARIPDLTASEPRSTGSRSGADHAPIPGVRQRHVRLASALAVALSAWLALAAWAQQRPVVPAVVVRTVGYVVDVRVDPAGLPPVSLVVVGSPNGSRLAPGTLVGSVPSKVLLDREGVWRFEARFGDRRSQIVALVVPNDPFLIVPFPVTPPTAAP